MESLVDRRVYRYNHQIHNYFGESFDNALSVSIFGAKKTSRLNLYWILEWFNWIKFNKL